jgi:hypothetical protein
MTGAMTGTMTGTMASANTAEIQGCPLVFRQSQTRTRCDPQRG